MLMGILGSVIGGALGLIGAHKNMVDQKNLMSHSIQIRVRDAEKAGISPLYALGAPTLSYPGSTVGDTLAGMGQDVGRAVESTLTPNERVDAYTGKLRELQLQRAGLENDLLRVQIARAAPGTAPAAPDNSAMIPGQGDTRDPDFAQKIQNKYGNIPSDILGLAGMFSDLTKYGYDQYMRYKAPVPPASYAPRQGGGRYGSYGG